jgi:glyoxylase-like metal-dependent hydrolase (beta-lactamase superfamily II)
MPSASGTRTGGPALEHQQPDQVGIPKMQTVIPGLHASAPQGLSFAPSVHVRAFLLQRPQGNLLVYSAGPVADDVRAIEELGGISRHYLNHWHEAAFGGGDRVASTFEAPLFCHEDERQSVSETSEPAGTFSERHMQGDDFEVIPIPGHTSGATAYLWHGGGHRCLFTGDSVYLREGEWVAAVLESSDRGAYLESLELIKDLDFDVLVPWVATAGRPFHARTDRADARRRIDAILERVRGGDDH